MSVCPPLPEHSSPAPECTWTCNAGYARVGAGCAPCGPSLCAAGQLFVPNMCPQSEYCVACPEPPTGAALNTTVRGMCTYACAAGWVVAVASPLQCAPCAGAVCPSGSPISCTYGSVQGYTVANHCNRAACGVLGSQHLRGLRGERAACGSGGCAIQ